MSRSINSICILITSLLVISCSSNSLSKKSLEMKNVAIINNIPNEFLIHKRQIPPSDKKFKVPEWSAKEYLSNEVAEALKKKNPSKNFIVVNIPLADKVSPSKIDYALIKNLKNKGFDGVVLINNAGVYAGRMEFIAKEKGGFLMFVTYSLTGKEYREILAQYSLSLYELSEGKRISYTAHSENHRKFQDKIKAADYHEYSSEEILKIESELKKSIDSSLRKVADKLFK